MNVKRIVALLAVICLVSCAPVETGMKIEGDTLSCDRPRVDIHRLAIINEQFAYFDEVMEIQ